MVAPDRDGPQDRNQFFVGNRLRRSQVLIARLALVGLPLGCRGLFRLRGLGVVLRGGRAGPSFLLTRPWPWQWRGWHTMIASTMGNTGTKIRFTRMDTGQSPQAWVSRMIDEALRTRSDGCDETGCRGFGNMRELPMPVKLSSSSSDKLANLGNSCKFV